eukprot:CAMPEP_0178924708 /NCGR_PEP_ID=MMETSP0786-20121207/17477_1 /TAXON_ID=186022 /ORGANISM="Thalassionema frauenfeldii, Strain CCMP 1798" /LENGTH=216 /DNA_ID=CAMNT_0020599449 /DNA_START=89 /DNA_END=736 /DNA_ORIENTATION=-
MNFIDIAQSSWDLHRHLAERSAAARLLQTDELDLNDSNKHTPLLSPSAEAELYLLASNFLLYVALVIITTLIAKVYFPSSLQPRHKNPMVSGSYNYKGHGIENDESEDEDEEYDDEYEDDDGDDDDDEYDEYESDSDGEIEDEFLDSGDEDALCNVEAPKVRKGTRNSIYEDEGVVPLFTMRPNIMEFDQETMSKAQVIKRLLVCTAMLNVTFVSW